MVAGVDSIREFHSVEYIGKSALLSASPKQLDHFSHSDSLWCYTMPDSQGFACLFLLKSASELLYFPIERSILLQCRKTSLKQFRFNSVDICIIEFWLDGIHAQSNYSPAQYFADEKVAADSLHLLIFNPLLAISSPCYENTGFSLWESDMQNFLDFDLIAVLLAT